MPTTNYFDLKVLDGYQYLKKETSIHPGKHFLF